MFKYKAREINSINGGEQHLFKFMNGLGTSVVRHSISYGGEQGLWELAVIELKGEDDWNITYDTEITDDVLGHLSIEEVNNILERITDL